MISFRRHSICYSGFFFQEEYLIEETDPEVTLEELEQILEPAVLEYYENNNSQEFLVIFSCHFYAHNPNICL